MTEAEGAQADAKAIILGHVSMTKERYARIPTQERAQVWSGMIARLGIDVPFLPFPFEDEERNIVGLNLIGIPAGSTRPSRDVH